VPVTVIARMLTFRSTLPPIGGPVQSWVYTLVYSEFVGLGIGLTLALVLYASESTREDNGSPSLCEIGGD
jgi:hypothetical protein